MSGLLPAKLTEVPASTEPVEVVGIGAATWDDLWIVPFFRSDEGVTAAIARAQMGGGPVATALCVLSKLGHSTALLDVVGGDETGQQIIADLHHHGVSTQGIRWAEDSRSAVAVIQVRQWDGARQITYLPSDAGELKLDAAQRALLAQARLLHINGRHEAAAREAIGVANEHGLVISLDGGAGRYRESIRDLVEMSHLRIVSRDFARQFCGSDDLAQMMAMLLEPPAQLVVITEGLAGSHVALPDGFRYHQPAYLADPVVDTTGCGDVYHGAFLHGWLEKKTATECAEFASRVAAQNAQGLGGRWMCQSF
ncbi:Sugar or nucleoside kinase, ribokinase family [Prosthecobacter debontii]|uniref:Sugar or nucleoside kinase, ribokinase family n=1 Tax=Prosthecobacter debontii TaxID=48467 RepID=A0A1T4YZC0_9BACT|nr:carbohydrate kinase family protein [Prosthecobacter debontii]SKB07086.1 Sugar or nucleoside kinase, ribokinase family [Prosthecobacter debontii]